MSSSVVEGDMASQSRPAATPKSAATERSIRLDRSADPVRNWRLSCLLEGLEFLEGSEISDSYLSARGVDHLIADLEAIFAEHGFERAPVTSEADAQKIEDYISAGLEAAGKVPPIDPATFEEADEWRPYALDGEDIATINRIRKWRRGDGAVTFSAEEMSELIGLTTTILSAVPQTEELYAALRRIKAHVQAKAEQTPDQSADPVGDAAQS